MDHLPLLFWPCIWTCPTWTKRRYLETAFLFCVFFPRWHYVTSRASMMVSAAGSRPLCGCPTWSSGERSASQLVVRVPSRLAAASVISREPGTPLCPERGGCYLLCFVFGVLDVDAFLMSGCRSRRRCCGAQEPPSHQSLEPFLEQTVVRDIKWPFETFGGEIKVSRRVLLTSCHKAALGRKYRCST